MLVDRFCRDGVQELAGHGRRPDVTLVFELVVGWHRYSALGEKYANPASQKTTAIKLLGTTRCHIDHFLDVGNDHDGLTEWRQEDLKHGTLEFCSLGGKPSETLSGIFCIFDKVESIPERVPSRFLGVRYTRERFWQAFPVDEDY